MVRFATAQLARRSPAADSWFPFLGLGSPQFLHYQSLPAMFTGLVGLVVGPDAAFRWSLYLLLSLWPVSVYLAARLFGARPTGRRRGGRDVAVPGQRDRDRLRAARVRLDRVRGVDPAVGVDDAAAGVGL